MERTWFIDRDRVYKMMKALSGYGDGAPGRIEVTDDSGNDEDTENDDDGSDEDEGSDEDDVIQYIGEV